MLAPVAETDAGERALLELGLQSARRWPDFAAQLADVSGMEVGYRLIPMVDSTQNGELLGRIRSIRKKVAQDVGCLAERQTEVGPVEGDVPKPDQRAAGRLLIAQPAVFR